MARLSSAIGAALSRAFVRWHLYASWFRVAMVVWAVKSVLYGAQHVATEERQATTGDREAKGTTLV